MTDQVVADETEWDRKETERTEKHESKLATFYSFNSNVDTLKDFKAKENPTLDDVYQVITSITVLWQEWLDDEIGEDYGEFADELDIPHKFELFADLEV